MTLSVEIPAGSIIKRLTLEVPDKIRQYNHQKLPFYSPSNSLTNKIRGKPACLVFYTDAVQKTNVDNLILVNTESHFIKAVPSKIDSERLSPYFAFRLHDVQYADFQEEENKAERYCWEYLARNLKD